MNQIIIDSIELGHYDNSKGSTNGKYLEPTGSRCICGIYDLGNVFKILACSNQEAGGLWLGGGVYFRDGHNFPLANLNHFTNVDHDYYGSVGMLVL